MTLKRLAVKMTPKNAHLISLSEEQSGTMLFKVLRTGFVQGTLKSFVSCQLNFRLFVRCLLKV